MIRDGGELRERLCNHASWRQIVKRLPMRREVVSKTAQIDAFQIAAVCPDAAI
jgi:hypothetical protein